MASDALDSEIEPVGNPAVEPSRSVDGLLAVDPGAGKIIIPPKVYPMVLNASLSASENWPTMGTIAAHRVSVGMTESLARKNSPSSERWYRYAPGVVSSKAKATPLGSGLLHNSRWYRRSVGLWVSGSLPPESVVKSNAVSIIAQRSWR